MTRKANLSLRAQRSNPSCGEYLGNGRWIASSLLLLAMMLIVLVPQKVYAQTAGFFSAAYLQELCKSDALGHETVAGGHTACQAYIAGVIDYHKLMKSLGTAPTIDLCVPNTVSMKRLQAIVWVYLKKHGEHSEFVASPAVTLALYAYYPCKKKR